MGTHFKGTTQEINALNAYIKLIRCANSLSSKLEGGIRKIGLTLSQFGVLEVLLHLGPQYQNDLCKKLLKSGGNISTVVYNLEKSELIRRERDSEDRRLVRVSLTEKGRQLIERFIPDHVTEITRAMSVLSEEEQHQLGDLCKSLGLQVGKS